MKKGKFGIDLRFFAILSFVLAFTGWSTSLVMILGYVILVEKDEWLSRQVMQATMLSLVTSVYTAITSLVKNFSGYSYPYLSYNQTEFTLGEMLTTGYLTVTDIISGCLNILIAILVIVAIANVIKGKDAGMPLFSKWAYKAYGILPAYHQAQPQQQSQQQYQQPQAQQQYQQAAQPQAQQYQQRPAQQQYQAPAAPQAPYNENVPPTE